MPLVKPLVFTMHPVCSTVETIRLNWPSPQYGWDFPEEILENFWKDPRKRSQSVSWNSP